MLVPSYCGRLRHLFGNTVLGVVRATLGFRIRWLSRILYKKRPFFGLRNLDRRFLEIIDHSPSFYIEIGANDGVSQSNTLALELFYGWTGMLIEPASSTFRKLKRNRSRRRNYLLKAACDSANFPAHTVQLGYADLMSSTLGIESDVADPLMYVAEAARYLSPGDSTRIETVTAVTMTEALEAAGAPEIIGFLSLDVEGTELEVLHGIDFERYSFEWLLIESRNLKRISAFLSPRGYRLHSQLSHHDYLFSRIRN